MTRRSRQRIAKLAQFIALSPMMPFFLVHCLGQMLVEITDWIVEGRWLHRACLRVQHRIEMWGLRR